MTEGDRLSRLERQIDALMDQTGQLAVCVARLEEQTETAARSRELSRQEMRELAAALKAVAAGIEEYRRDKRTAWGMLAGLGLASGGIGAAMTRWLGGS